MFDWDEVWIGSVLSLLQIRLISLAAATSSYTNIVAAGAQSLRKRRMTMGRMMKERRRRRSILVSEWHWQRGYLGWNSWNERTGGSSYNSSRFHVWTTWSLTEQHRALSSAQDLRATAKKEWKGTESEGVQKYKMCKKYCQKYKIWGFNFAPSPKCVKYLCNYLWFYKFIQWWQLQRWPKSSQKTVLIRTFSSTMGGLGSRVGGVGEWCPLFRKKS